MTKKFRMSKPICMGTTPLHCWYHPLASPPRLSLPWIKHSPSFDQRQQLAWLCSHGSQNLCIQGWERSHHDLKNPKNLRIQHKFERDNAADWLTMLPVPLPLPSTMASWTIILENCVQLPGHRLGRPCRHWHWQWPSILDFPSRKTPQRQEGDFSVSVVVVLRVGPLWHLPCTLNNVKPWLNWSCHQWLRSISTTWGSSGVTIARWKHDINIIFSVSWGCGSKRRVWRDLSRASLGSPY